jgi:hypothetical protein
MLTGPGPEVINVTTMENVRLNYLVAGERRQ